MKTVSDKNLLRIQTALRNMLSEAGKCEAWAIKSRSVATRSDIPAECIRTAEKYETRAASLRKRVAQGVATYQRRKHKPEEQPCCCYERQP